MAGRARAKWPWGRLAPERRLRELQHQKEVRQAQIPIIEDRAREAIARIAKSIEAIEADMEVAREFQILERREQCKELAYTLAEYGIQRIEEVNACATIEDLDALKRRLAEEIRNAGRKDEDAVDEIESFFKT